MANRYLYQFRGSFEPGIVSIMGKVSFAAAGAPTLVAGQNRGIASIVRNSAGNYTITLQDSYQRLLMIEQRALNATPPAAPAMFVVSENVANLPAPTIVIQMNAAGVATDPASGEIMLLEINVKNSSA